MSGMWWLHAGPCHVITSARVWPLSPDLSLHCTVHSLPLPPQFDYYGALTPLRTVANISTPEATLLVVQVGTADCVGVWGAGRGGVFTGNQRAIRCWVC